MTGGPPSTHQRSLHRRRIRFARGSGRLGDIREGGPPPSGSGTWRSSAETIHPVLLGQIAGDTERTHTRPDTP
jgi:hypothetical protein